MNMNFEELTNLVKEDAETASKQFKDLVGTDTAPEFISLPRYQNKKGEIGRYVINIGLSYMGMKEKITSAVEKIISVPGNPDAKDYSKIKELIEPKILKAAGSPEGEVNGWSVQEILASIPQAVSNILSSQSRSFNRKEQEKPTAQAAAMEDITKGVKRNMDTGAYYIVGKVKSRKLLSEPVKKEPKKSRLPENVAREFIEKSMKLDHPSTFIIDPSTMDAIKARSVVIDVDGEEKNVNAIEIEGDLKHPDLVNKI